METTMQAYYAEQAAQERKNTLRSLRKETYQWLGTTWDTSALATKTFQTFNQTREQYAYDTVKAFAANPVGHLLLRGSSGTGKTHLLAALCNELRTREKPLGSRFATVLSLFHALQECMKNEYTDMSYTDLIHRAIKTPLLILDDIDKAKWTAFREEVYFDILDGRTMNGRPTAISTNREDIVQYIGFPCASRLSIGLIEVEMVGGDYRPELV